MKKRLLSSHQVSATWRNSVQAREKALSTLQVASEVVVCQDHLDCSPRGILPDKPELEKIRWETKASYRCPQLAGVQGNQNRVPNERLNQDFSSINDRILEIGYWKSDIGHPHLVYLTY